MNLQESFKQEAIKWAEAQVKYVHRGVSKLGCDCTGLIIGICRSLGYLGTYKLRQYPPDWNLHTGRGNYIEEELNKVANEIPIHVMQEGDILAFYLHTCLAHVGILVNKDNGMFVHVFDGSKKCQYAIYKNSAWSSRFKKVFRLDPIKMERFHG